jgi:hypothetical protein
MQIKVRYPSLRGKSIKTVAKQNEDELIKTMKSLVVIEQSKPKKRPVRKPVEGGRITVKKPKTFAL